MNKKRILGGFSLVEMMLLLLIVSLMIASGVTVISKKHVKVPHLAMHGSYMCYYKNVDGVPTLWEERYIGTGLNKKTLDQEATGGECLFTPPDRVSYLHIQATAGGGGGGDAGYRGGNIITKKSAVDKISPFKITPELFVDLKGLGQVHLDSYGGYIYAYANAVGDNGDSGAGGNLYYIEKDGSTVCKKFRHWEYEGTDGKYWECKKEPFETCASYQECYVSGHDRCPHESYYPNGCTDSEGNTYGCWKVDYYYDCNWGSASCKKGREPYSIFTRESELEDVRVTDYYITDWALDAPKHYKVKGEANGVATKEERQVRREQQSSSTTLCSFGNTVKFAGYLSDGIFGSFTGLDGVGVSCSTAGIIEGYGDDMYPIVIGQTAPPHTAVTAPSSKYYKEKIEYDPSEKNPTAYGSLCYSEANPNESSNIPGRDIPNCDTFSIPFFGSSDPGPGYKEPGNYPIYKDYTVSNGFYNYSCPSWDVMDYSSCGPSIEVCINRYYTSEPECHWRPLSEDPSACEKVCEKCISGASYTPPSSSEEIYIAGMIEGGAKSDGTQCSLGGVRAGFNITYEGESSVVPGIRGSDKNCTTASGTKYSAYYSEAEWNSQPKCRTESGTDTLGYAKITLNGNTCIANQKPPTKGTGAKKDFTGPGTPTPGEKGEDGTGTGGGTAEGSNFVGYYIDNIAKENYKYSYQYTWDTNYMQYGDGGKAGEYQTKIVRAIKDKAIRIVVGRGGAGGAEGTGNSGENGEDTVIEGIMTVKGGAGGPGGLMTPVEQLPIYYSGLDFTKMKVGNPGEKRTSTSIKSNIMNLILPIDNEFTLQQWVTVSGEGGNGGGSTNICWASEWRRWFEGQELHPDYSIRAEDVACRTGTYWSSTPVAEDGLDGLVLIRW